MLRYYPSSQQGHRGCDPDHGRRGLDAPVAVAAVTVGDYPVTEQATVITVGLFGLHDQALKAPTPMPASAGSAGATVDTWVLVVCADSKPDTSASSVEAMLTAGAVSEWRVLPARTSGESEGKRLVTPKRAHDGGRLAATLVVGGAPVLV